MAQPTVVGVTLADILNARRTITAKLPLFGEATLTYNPNLWDEKVQANISPEGRVTHTPFIAALDVRMPASPDDPTPTPLTAEVLAQLGLPLQRAIATAILADFFPPEPAPTEEDGESAPGPAGE